MKSRSCAVRVTSFQLREKLWCNLDIREDTSAKDRKQAYCKNHKKIEPAYTVINTGKVVEVLPCTMLVPTFIPFDPPNTCLQDKWDPTKWLQTKKERQKTKLVNDQMQKVFFKIRLDFDVILKSMPDNNSLKS